MAAFASVGDRLVRRNSVLTLCREGDQLYIAKQYHGKYRPEDELAACRIAAPIIDSIDGLHLAAVVPAANQPQTLRIEFVDAPDLSVHLATYGIAGFTRWWPVVLEYLGALHENAVTLDTDLSNFLVSETRLTVIDPTMQALGLQHGSAAIFFLGITKHRIRFWFRFSEQWAWRKLRTQAIQAYLKKTGTPAETLYSDMRRYIDQVIAWNKYESTTETLGKRIARRCLYIPVWRLVQWQLGRS